ncbi:hypothetical protein [Sinomonas sp. P47F7]|uniref:hypothetical protein n=1 Tax=Sinomonas sp. P47F7 TaxID=3410987 RepID=UPI003BF49478
MRQFFHGLPLDPVPRHHRRAQHGAHGHRDAGSPAFGELKDAIAAHPHVELVYSARDEELNQSVVLRDVLAGSGR